MLLGSNNIILGLFAFMLVGCISPKNKEDEVVFLDKSIISSDSLTALDLYLKPYSDSLNDLTVPPKFLEDPYFDYNNIGIWSTAHNPTCLRKKILNHIRDCNALKYISESGVSNISARPGIKNGVEAEDCQKSWNDLIIDRMKILGCK